MTWQKLIITTNQEQAETIADYLNEECDAAAVSLVAHDTQEVFQLEPEESPLWQQTEVHALYPVSTELEPIMAKLNQWLKAPVTDYRSETLPEEDWVRKTQADFPPIAVGDRLLISPSWHDASDFPGSLVKIDPGLAFGTGTHPTTLLCLEWLSNQDLHGKTCIDYGCGSGILAIAADSLGADCIYATDHDPQAIEATNNNLKLNQQRADAFTICRPEAMPDIQADIMIANILAKPLLQLAPTLAALCKDDAQIVLSGILAGEEQQIIDCYQHLFDITEVYEKDGWARIVGCKRTLQ